MKFLVDDQESSKIDVNLAISATYYERTGISELVNSVLAKPSMRSTAKALISAVVANTLKNNPDQLIEGFMDTPTKYVFGDDFKLSDLGIPAMESLIDTLGEVDHDDIMSKAYHTLSDFHELESQVVFLDPSAVYCGRTVYKHTWDVVDGNGVPVLSLLRNGGETDLSASVASALAKTMNPRGTVVVASPPVTSVKALSDAGFYTISMIQNTPEIRDEVLKVRSQCFAYNPGWFIRDLDLEIDGVVRRIIAIQFEKSDEAESILPTLERGIRDAEEISSTIFHSEEDALEEQAGLIRTYLTAPITIRSAVPVPEKGGYTIAPKVEFCPALANLFNSWEGMFLLATDLPRKSNEDDAFASATGEDVLLLFLDQFPINFVKEIPFAPSPGMRLVTDLSNMLNKCMIAVMTIEGVEMPEYTLCELFRDSKLKFHFDQEIIRFSGRPFEEAKFIETARALRLSVR